MWTKSWKVSRQREVPLPDYVLSKDKIDTTTFRGAMEVVGTHNERMREAAQLGKVGDTRVVTAVEELRAGRSDAWVGMYTIVAAMASKDVETLSTTARENTSFLLRARAAQALGKIDQVQLFNFITDPQTPLQLRRVALPVLRCVPAHEAEDFFARLLAEPAWGGPWQAVWLLQRLHKEGSTGVVVRWLPQCAAAAQYFKKESSNSEQDLKKEKPPRQTADLEQVYQGVAARHPEAMLTILRNADDFDFRYFRAARELAASTPDGLLAAIKECPQLLRSKRARWFLIRPLAKRRPLEVLRLVQEAGRLDGLVPYVGLRLLKPSRATPELRQAYFETVQSLVQSDKAATHAEYDEVLTVICKRLKRKSRVEEERKVTRDYALAEVKPPTVWQPIMEHCEATHIPVRKGTGGRPCAFNPPKQLLLALAAGPIGRSIRSALSAREAGLHRLLDPEELEAQAAVELASHVASQALLQRVTISSTDLVPLQAAVSRALQAAKPSTVDRLLKDSREVFSTARRIVPFGYNLLLFPGNISSHLETPLVEGMLRLIANRQSVFWVLWNTEEKTVALEGLPLDAAEETLKALIDHRDPDVRQAVHTTYWACAARDFACGSRKPGDAAKLGAVLEWIIRRIAKEDESVRCAVTGALLCTSTLPPPAWLDLPESIIPHLKELLTYTLKWRDPEVYRFWRSWSCTLVVAARVKRDDAGVSQFTADILELEEVADPLDVRQTYQSLLGRWEAGAKSAFDLLGSQGNSSIQSELVQHWAAVRQVATEEISKTTRGMLPWTEDALLEHCSRTAAELVAETGLSVVEMLDLQNLATALGLMRSYGPECFLASKEAHQRVLIFLSSLSTLSNTSSTVVSRLLFQLVGLSPSEIITSGKQRRRESFERYLVEAVKPFSKAEKAFLSWQPLRHLLLMNLANLKANRWIDFDDNFGAALMPGLPIAAAVMKKWPFDGYTNLGRALKAKGVPSALAYEVCGWHVPYQDLLQSCADLWKAARPSWFNFPFQNRQRVFNETYVSSGLAEKVAKNMHVHRSFRDVMISAMYFTHSLSPLVAWADRWLLGPVTPLNDTVRMALLQRIEKEYFTAQDQRAEAFHNCWWMAAERRHFLRGHWRRNPQLRYSDVRIGRKLQRKPSRRFRFQRGKAASRRKQKWVNVHADADSEEDVYFSDMQSPKKFISVLKGLQVPQNSSLLDNLVKLRPYGGLRKEAVSTAIKQLKPKDLFSDPRRCSLANFIPEVADMLYEQCLTLSPGPSFKFNIAISTLLHPRLQQQYGAKLLTECRGVDPIHRFWASHRLVEFAALFHEYKFCQLLLEGSRRMIDNQPLEQPLGLTEHPRYPQQRQAPAWFLSFLRPDIQRAVFDVCTSNTELLGTLGRKQQSALIEGHIVAVGLPCPVGIPPVGAPEHPFNCTLRRTLEHRFEQRRLTAELEAVGTQDACLKKKVANALVRGGAEADFCLHLLGGLATMDNPFEALKVLVNHIGRGVSSKSAIPATVLALQCVPQSVAASVLNMVLGRASTKAAARSQLSRAAVQLLVDQPEYVSTLLLREWSPAEGREDTESITTTSSWELVDDVLKEEQGVTQGDTEIDTGDEEISALPGAAPNTSTKVSILAALVSSPLLGKMPVFLERLRELTDPATMTEESKYIMHEALNALAGVNGVHTLNVYDWPSCAPAGLAGVCSRMLCVPSLCNTATVVMLRWASYVERTPQYVVYKEDAEVIIESLLAQPSLKAVLPVFAVLTCRGYPDLLLTLLRRKVAELDEGPLFSKRQVLKFIGELCEDESMFKCKREVLDEAASFFLERPSTCRFAFTLLATRQEKLRGQDYEDGLKSFASGLEHVGWHAATEVVNKLDELINLPDDAIAVSNLVKSESPYERYVAVCLIVKLVNSGKMSFDEGVTLMEPVSDPAAVVAKTSFFLEH